MARWLALERLAMVWEWELHDPRRALALAEKALAALNGDTPVHYQRLIHRRDRLLQKASKLSL